MNPLIQQKKATPLTLAVFVLVCLTLSPRVQAVVPAPDGGYPGGNTAEGQAALLSLTIGGFNTAVGFLSLRSNTTGGFNTAIGAGALLANTGDNDTATGAGALLSNTTGARNTANGAFALFSNTTGVENTANGAAALQVNTTGSGNTANGLNALFLSTTGSDNTATGAGALFSNTIGNDNTATGAGALFSNTIGNGNTANGNGALSNNTTGNGNIALGFNAGFGVTTVDNVICIGADGQNVSNSCYIGQIFGATSSGGAAVLINSDGRLGTVPSSRRFKEEIKPMERASEALLALKPVTFRYKKQIDPAGTSQFGLVAEEVEKVNPDLVVRDKEGKPYSVRYDQVNAMLLNEFFKEHKKLKALEGTVATLAATVREQALQIQKVSARLEASKPASQVVNNP